MCHRVWLVAIVPWQMGFSAPPRIPLPPRAAQGFQCVQRQGGVGAVVCCVSHAGDDSGALQRQRHEDAVGVFRVIGERIAAFEAKAFVQFDGGLKAGH